MDRMTSYEEVLKMSAPSKPVFINYIDLAKYKNFDELFDKNGNLILLFIQMDSENSGHYIALIRKKGIVYILNSYGMEPEKDLDFSKFKLYPHLARLILKAKKHGQRVEYNDYKLQKLKSGIATCGRWASIFFKYFSDDSFKTLDDFIRIFKFVKNDMDVDLDELIVEITDKYLNS